jgi:DNA-binding HxlR family transcriptional regulator
MEELLEHRDTWSASNCSIARTMEIVGTRSAMLILREAFLGTRRFDDFARRIGIGEPAAAARLKEMVDAGLLEKVPYRVPGQRTRFEYRLTPKGRDLYPVITALRQWGDTWAADEHGPSIRATHRRCGEPVHAVLRCAGGHDVADSEVEIEAGPGLLRT